MDGKRETGGRSSCDILSTYRLGKTLGIGAFGKVKLASHNLTGLKVAIKILDRQSINDSAAEKVRREINILRLLSHPHIVRLYEVVETRLKIYVVMEYMNSGELYDYITENQRLQEDEARNFFQQIISGIEYCHLHKVVHRDLKPENLLMDSKCNVKIADFGLGNIMCDGHFFKTSCGSPNYAAPELISEQLYAGPEVDVWSSGVILYALLCGRLPFDDENLTELYRKIKNGRYTFPNHLSYGARDLIARMLIVDPINRITLPELRQHPWFQQNLLQYIAVGSTNALHNPEEKIDRDVLQDMAKRGFDIHEVIESLNKHLQNEVTVTYYILLHNHFGKFCSHQRNELLGFVPFEGTNNPEIHARSVPPVQGNWALGFKSKASPHGTMINVLNVFQSLNVKWKKTGHFNVKCLWLPSVSSDFGAALGDGPLAKYSCGHELQSQGTSSTRIRSYNVVKFEIQLYRTSGDVYVLDLQQIHGSPLIFLEICAAFFALAAV